MRLKKILMLVVTMILVAAISVTATMAYLKSQTNVTQNAFAVGNVKVSLDEAKVNENGQPVDEDGNVVDDVKDAARVLENECKLIPGRTYMKAPTIYVEEGSEDCIVFVVLRMPKSLVNVIYDVDEYGGCIFPQILRNGWRANGYAIPDGAVDSTEFCVVFCYNYAQPVAANTTLPFFESITIDKSVTQDQLKGADLNEIKITAYAFQNEGTDKMSDHDVWSKILELCDPFNQEK